jgi:hypothetical protein
MAGVTYYVALPFIGTDDGIVAGEPTGCFNANAAVMRAEVLSRKEGHVGASPNFLITLASLKSPVAGSPVRPDSGPLCAPD